MEKKSGYGLHGLDGEHIGGELQMQIVPDINQILLLF